MKRILSIMFFCCIFVSCSNYKTSNSSTKEKVVNDTIVKEYGYLQSVPNFEQKDSTLLIDNESYKLTYSALIDTSKNYIHIERYLDKGKNHRNIYKGYDATYNITLKAFLERLFFRSHLQKTILRIFLIKVF